MKQPHEMTTEELRAYIQSGEEEFLDEAYDELDARTRIEEIERETYDWTEHDYWAAQSERLELFMREY